MIDLEGIPTWNGRGSDVSAILTEISSRGCAVVHPEQPLVTLDRFLATVVLSLFLAETASAAQEYKVLYSFTGGTDGALPAADLTSDDEGNLYGTTVGGGTSTNCDGGCGTVFKLIRYSNDTWQETILYSFQGGNDGMYPYSGVIRDTKGNLYGSTSQGGAGGSCIYGDGCGTIFKLAVSARGYTKDILYNFTGGTDGAGPGELALDGSNNLYGTTSDGGKLTACDGIGCGVVFELLRGSGGHWTQKVVHTFSGGRDGARGSLGRLFLDRSGNLLGLAEAGGNLNCPNFPTGCGVAFELSGLSGGRGKFTVIHRFYGPPGARFPYGGLISQTNGHLYGTTLFGGSSDQGAVFELAPSPGGYKETVLYSFEGVSDGANPTCTLAFDGTGDLLGTASMGGDTDLGVVFKLTLDMEQWKEAAIHSFGPPLMERTQATD